MFKITFSFILPFFLIFNSANADECLPNIEALLPKVEIPEINLKIDNNYFFCFDDTSIEDKATINTFKKLKDKNSFDQNNCILNKNITPETSVEISDLLFQTTKSNLNVYSPDSIYASDTALLIMTNSKNKQFISKAFRSSKNQMEDPDKLTTKDTLEIAGATITSSLVGIIIERNVSAFKNSDGSLQHDKLLHSNYGALINIGSVAGSYLIIETAGVGNKLNLSKNQKKWAILLSGTVVGMLAGYGKERLYDYKHQDTHTYDPHLKGDMGATWLGAGILNPVAGAISFQF